MLTTSSLRLKAYFQEDHFGWELNSRFKRFLRYLGFSLPLFRLQVLRLFGRENLDAYREDPLIYDKAIRGDLGFREFLGCLAWHKVLNPFKWLAAAVALGFAIVNGVIKTAFALADLILGILKSPVHVVLFLLRFCAEEFSEMSFFKAAFWFAMLLLAAVVLWELTFTLLAITIFAGFCWLLREGLPLILQVSLFVVSFLREVAESFINTLTSPYNSVVKPLIVLAIQHPLRAAAVITAGLFGVGLLLAGIFLTGGALAPALLFLKPFVAMMSPLVNALAGSVGLAAAKGIMTALVLTVPAFVGNLVRAVVHAAKRAKNNFKLMNDVGSQFLDVDHVAQRAGYGSRFLKNWRSFEPDEVTFPQKLTPYEKMLRSEGLWVDVGDVNIEVDTTNVQSMLLFNAFRQRRQVVGDPASFCAGAKGVGASEINPPGYTADRRSPPPFEENGNYRLLQSAVGGDAAGASDPPPEYAAERAVASPNP